jgi:hypothetical protein
MERDATRHVASPLAPSGSRLVATILTPAQACSSASTAGVAVPMRRPPFQLLDPVRAEPGALGKV